MKNIRALQLLVYVAFGLLIVRNVLPGAIRGFKDGFNDGYNMSHGVKSHGQLIPAVLSSRGLAGLAGKDLETGSNYTLHNISINADIGINGHAVIPVWLTVIAIVLVLGIAVMLIMIAYNINTVIMNIAAGNIFDPFCTRYIRRTGMLLLIYCIADVVYQRIMFAQVQGFVRPPLQAINTTEFNFPVMISAIIALIVAEAFKQGYLLKQEQDLTI